MSPFSSNQHVWTHPPFPLNPAYLKKLLDIGRACHALVPRKQYRMVLRCLYWHPETWQWFSFIARAPLLRKLWAVQDNLPEKLHRNLLRIDYPIGKRLQVLINHYTLVEQLIDAKLLEQALFEGGLVLCHIPIDAEHQFVLQLGYGIYPGKEGELSVSMYDGDSTMLARISFSLIRCDQGHALFIGGLQGPSCPDARFAVNQASKVCYGLAPRRMVLEALLAFAKSIKAEALYGVADELHTFRHKTDKHLSYDVCWSELGGVLNGQGDYKLPLEPVHKDYADTPSKRRAKYRRQHLILEAINNQTQSVLKSEPLEIRRDNYLSKARYQVLQLSI